MKIELANAWIIKYFIILLIDRLSLLNIRGINIIMLTSKAAQSWNQLSVDTAMKVDINSTTKKIRLILE